ncbi:hypothetical protein [Pseudomonas abietaniphila]|uniref:hypothetical protein n=1 Tax=Pseudomonas abietaniphila TaxID=89065 RepID=UPI000AB042D7|nr:hypothetical protein [Pseudomonas abietaniphila]
MRVFGMFVLVIAVLLLIVAMSMDVTVTTGIGRVNNFGLMAERQNLMMFGGIALIAALLMVIFGGRSKSNSTSQAVDIRDCPYCAEPIKLAAVKCKHCGADVEPATAPKLKQGWVARVSCRDDAESKRARQCMEEMDLDVVPMIDKDVGAGPYATKEEAISVARRIGESKKLYATAIFRDVVTGDYSPL